MKAALLIGLVSLVACVDSDDPELAKRQQDERIEVHGCRPGFLELGEGDDMTCIRDPRFGWGGGGGEDRGGVRGGGDDGGGGGGGGPVGTPVMGEPGVTIYRFPFGTLVCEVVCATLSVALCESVRAACVIGTVYTLGGLMLPCTGIVALACATGVAGDKACSEAFCR